MMITKEAINMNECIHFDGKECRNQASNHYGSDGEWCIECEDKE